MLTLEGASSRSGNAETAAPQTPRPGDWEWRTVDAFIAARLRVDALARGGSALSPDRLYRAHGDPRD
ncbi:MAG: hypothetical protein AB7O28_08215 [Vicinamibacterales bacterium]